MKPKSITRKPRLIFTAKAKGGVGASTLALCIADLFDIAEQPLHVFQVDDQARLAKSIGRDVTSIKVAFSAARRDPSLLIRAFDPIAHQIERMRTIDESALIDFGPTETARFLEWTELAEIGDDLDAFGLPTVALIPLVAEPEAIRAAARTLAGFERALPSTRRIVVLNERDGPFDRLHPASEAARAFTQDLGPHLSGAEELRMPAIEAGSWRFFEAACLRFTDAVAFTTEEVIALTGLSRPEAKIVRGDVAAWLSFMQTELSRLALVGEPS